MEGHLIVQVEVVNEALQFTQIRAGSYYVQMQVDIFDLGSRLDCLLETLLAVCAAGAEETEFASLRYVITALGKFNPVLNDFDFAL